MKLMSFVGIFVLAAVARAGGEVRVAQVDAAGAGWELEMRADGRARLSRLLHGCPVPVDGVSLRRDERANRETLTAALRRVAARYEVIERTGWVAPGGLLLADDGHDVRLFGPRHQDTLTSACGRWVQAIAVVRRDRPGMALLLAVRARRVGGGEPVLVLGCARRQGALVLDPRGGPRQEARETEEEDLRYAWAGGAAEAKADPVRAEPLERRYPQERTATPAEGEAARRFFAAEGRRLEARWPARLRELHGERPAGAASRGWEEDPVPSTLEEQVARADRDFDLAFDAASEDLEVREARARDELFDYFQAFRHLTVSRGATPGFTGTLEGDQGR